VSPFSQPWPNPPWTSATTVDEPWTQSMRFFHSKINLKINYPGNFAKRPLGFFVIKPQSLKFPRRPLVFEIFPKIPQATFQKFQIGPYNFFSPYLHNRNSNFGDSYAKILRITSCSILRVHLTQDCCILLIDCVCFMLGNVVPEPFSEYFQDQAFEKSQLFFADQYGKLP
jgi:hypothetical protein